MWSIIKENPKAVIFAILVHVVFVGVLIFSFSNSTPTVAVNPEVNIVKATVIDEGKIKQERKRKEEIKRKKEQERKAAERKKQQAKKKAEAKRLALKNKKEAEAKKRKAESERKKKEETQKRQAAELRKKQDEAERKAHEAELQRQLAEDEHQRKQQAQRVAQQKEVDRYRALIKQAISNKWRIPVSARQGQECILKLRLIPSGEVVRVEVVKSSGDTIFDRSVEAAVFKALPLPLPPAESNLFNEFREIKMPFRPESRN